MTTTLDYGCKTHDYPFACFACRKSFKRPLVNLKAPYRQNRVEREAFARQQRVFARTFRHKCPDCGGPCRFMGRDFKAPKKTDLRAWGKVERFIASGRTFYRGTPTSDIF